METLGDALPREQARCRDLLEDYRSIGPAGSFAAARIRDALKRADQAVIDGDLAAMIRIYQEMRKLE